jgi:cytosine/creatinine deaminase
MSFFYNFVVHVFFGPMAAQFIGWYPSPFQICQVGKRDDIRECFEMITARAARLMRRDDYGVEVGKSADLVVLDCRDRESAVAEVVTPLYGFKRGRPTFTRRPAELHRP